MHLGEGVPKKYTEVQKGGGGLKLINIEHVYF